LTTIRVHVIDDVGAFLDRVDLEVSVVVPFLGIHHEDITASPDFGVADLVLESFQIVGKIQSDEEHGNHTALVIPDRLIGGHVILAEQLRLAHIALALQ